MNQQKQGDTLGCLLVSVLLLLRKLFNKFVNFLSNRRDLGFKFGGGARGVIRRGGGVQVVYGPQVSVIKSELEDYMKNLS